MVIEFENNAPSAESDHACGDGGDQSVFLAEVAMASVKNTTAQRSNMILLENTDGVLSMRYPLFMLTCAHY